VTDSQATTSGGAELNRTSARELAGDIESVRTLTMSRQTIVVRQWKSAAHTPPAVMVHGLGGNSKNWSYLAPLLVNDVACIAPDLPGFGQSPPPRDGDYRPSGHANAVISVIDELFPGQRVHLFGNSLGGHVATLIAARRPDVVESLTLISPALPTFQPAKYSLTVPATASPVVGARLYRRYARHTPEERALRLANVVLSTPAAAPPGWLDMVADDFRAREAQTYGEDAYIQTSRELLRAYLYKGPDEAWRDAARVTAPTLLVFGKRDKLVPLAVARKARTAFSRSRLLLLPESGHVAQIEDADLVAAAWRRFVADDVLTSTS